MTSMFVSWTAPLLKILRHFSCPMHILVEAITCADRFSEWMCKLKNVLCSGAQGSLLSSLLPFDRGVLLLQSFVYSTEIVNHFHNQTPFYFTVSVFCKKKKISLIVAQLNTEKKNNTFLSISFHLICKNQAFNCNQNSI